MTFHDTRHHWATHLGIAGVPAEILKAWGGWSSLAMVERYCRMPKVSLGGAHFDEGAQGSR